MNEQQTLKQAISELRGCRDFEALKAFMLKSLEDQLEPEDAPDEGGISEEAAAIIAMLTDSEKVAVEYFEAIEDLTEENAMAALTAKRDTAMPKKEFFALCRKLLEGQKQQ